MRVGLNLLHARPEIGGGWNYMANVLRALTLLDRSFEFVVYSSVAGVEIVPRDARFELKVTGLPRRRQLDRVLHEQFVLPFEARGDRLDCLHWFANNRSLLPSVPAVVTVHDFKSLERAPELSFLKTLYLRRIAAFSCRRASALAPVSETTAEAAVRLFGVDRARMVVIANPIDAGFRRRTAEEIASLRERLGLPDEFWLYVAHTYPHKNHARLFQAYKLLRETTGCRWPLVLRGDREKGFVSLDRDLADAGIAKDVIWLPRLSPADMAALYSAATALVFASLYEGGGIPVLEAMACGCPVAASGIPTTHEFAGDAALIFDPENVESIAKAMRRFYLDPALRARFAAAGLERAVRFAPENIAKKIEQAYRMAASPRKSKQ